MRNKWCLIVALWLVAAPWALSQKVTPVNKAVESTAQQLTRALLQQGFQVGRGYAKLWAIEDCDYIIAKVRTCFGNNPAAPYLIAAVPPWPEEYVDDDSIIFGPSHDHIIDIHRFDPREAIVILVQMPPPARFFSEMTYIWTQQGSIDTTSPRYQAISADSYFNGLLRLFFMDDPNHNDRIFAFASLSNPINNVVLGNSAFGQLRYFIITPDAFMDTAVRNAFTSINVDVANVFTEQIPSKFVADNGSNSPGSDYPIRIGLDYEANDFLTGIRYAEPNDGGAPGTASDVWRKQRPVAVLRVRDIRRRDPQPYGALANLQPRTAVNESQYEPDLLNLATAVIQNWGHSGYGATTARFHDLQSEPAVMVGPSCVPVGENCLGDNWDASYQLYSPGPHSLDHGEVYAIAGTLGTETGNATYVGLSINDMGPGTAGVMPLFIGVGNVSDTVLKNTAHPYERALTNPDNLFFLYYFTRDCSGLEQLTEGHCLSLKKLMPAGDYAGFGVRDYVKPPTARGPDSAYVLPAILIKLTKPQ